MSFCCAHSVNWFDVFFLYIFYFYRFCIIRICWLLVLLFRMLFVPGCILALLSTICLAIFLVLLRCHEQNKNKPNKMLNYHTFSLTNAQETNAMFYVASEAVGCMVGVYFWFYFSFSISFMCKLSECVQSCKDFSISWLWNLQTFELATICKCLNRHIYLESNIVIIPVISKSQVIYKLDWQAIILCNISVNIHYTYQANFRTEYLHQNGEIS